MAAVRPVGRAVTKPQKKPDFSAVHRPGLGREQIKDRLALVGTLFAGVGILCWVLSRDAAIAAQNYQVQELKAQLEAVQRENAVLQSKVEQLSMPSRVTEVAKRMGLTYTAPGQWRVLPEPQGGDGR